MEFNNDTNANTGKSLIFVISQPRAGSTLLQRILAGHSQIHTASEPWIMLNPLIAIGNNSFREDHNIQFANIALLNFLDTLPRKEEDYFEGVRRMYAYLYNQTLEVSCKSLFLDKTPRYYLIIPELHKTFPEAHFIILLRNPLAVLCSIISTWISSSKNWFDLQYHYQDLLLAPQLLIEGLSVLSNKAIILHYEKLLANPEKQVLKLCTDLNIKFEGEMLDYGKKPLPKWQFGDQKKVYSNSRPNASNANAWIDNLNNPQVWRFAHDYLNILTPRILSGLGYSFEELKLVLQTKKPNKIQLSTTFPLKWLLKKTLCTEPDAHNIDYFRNVVKKWLIKLSKKP